MKKIILLLLAGMVVGAGVVYAQGVLFPAQINGCSYRTSAPTLTNGQSFVFSCDQNGKLITH